jgi:hypothetical protein
VFKNSQNTGFGNVRKEVKVTCHISNRIENSQYYASIQVFTAMKIQIGDFRVVTPCNVLVGYQRFGGPCWKSPTQTITTAIAGINSLYFLLRNCWKQDGVSARFSLNVKLGVWDTRPFKLTQWWHTWCATPSNWRFLKLTFHLTSWHTPVSDVSRGLMKIKRQTLLIFLISLYI